MLASKSFYIYHTFLVLTLKKIISLQTNACKVLEIFKTLENAFVYLISFMREELIFTFESKLKYKILLVLGHIVFSMSEKMHLLLFL